MTNKFQIKKIKINKKTRALKGGSYPRHSNAMLDHQWTQKLKLLGEGKFNIILFITRGCRFSGKG